MGIRPRFVFWVVNMNKESVLGVLYGVAYGDAMGMPSEAWSLKKIRQRFGRIETLLPGQDDHFISKGFHAGETTDDTAMTFLVADLLYDSGLKPEPEEFVRRIEAWAESTGKAQFVIGPSTHKAFDQIHAGVPVQEAGKSGTTNGASMRIAPVGIVMDYRNEEAFMDLVVRLSVATHYTDIAISAAAACAACVSSALRDGDPDKLPEVAMHYADLGMNYGTEIAGPTIRGRLSLALEYSSRYTADTDFEEALYEKLGTSVNSSESIPAALAIAMRCKEDVLRAGVISANIGADTDTIGAVSCAISGALAGAGAYPQEILSQLISQNTFDFEGTAEKLLHCIAN